MVVLGVVQDGGCPHVGCVKPCCQRARDTKAEHLRSAMGITDPSEGRCWLMDATPDLPRQLYELQHATELAFSGVLLTHAHIGHYTGLMYLGKEGLNGRRVPVYVMPRMRSFIEKNGPWKCWSLSTISI